MKSRKLLAVAVTAMSLGAVTGPITTYAATTDQDVNVTYDNTNVVTDPDNPNTPTWGVSIQTAVTFLDTAKERDANVELVGVNGHVVADLPSNLSVEIKVKSQKGMNLELDTTSTDKDPVAYTLTYGSTSVTGTTAIKVATLTKTAPKETGKATLTGAAKVKGTHKDVLTYTIEGKTSQTQP